MPSVINITWKLSRAPFLLQTRCSHLRRVLVRVVASVRHLVIRAKAGGRALQWGQHGQGEVTKAFEWFSSDSSASSGGNRLVPGWSQVVLMMRVSGCRVGRGAVQGQGAQQIR